MAGNIKLGVLAPVQCKGEFQELVHIFVIFQFEAHISYPGHWCSGSSQQMSCEEGKGLLDYLETGKCCGMFLDEEFGEVINFVTTLWSLAQF